MFGVETPLEKVEKGIMFVLMAKKVAACAESCSKLRIILCSHTAFSSRLIHRAGGRLP